MLCIVVLCAFLAGSASASRTVEDVLPHNKVGNYIDQVQGKRYTCQFDVAFVVDTSPSIGRDTLDSLLTDTLVNIQNELARLPNAPGDLSQGSELHLVLFGKGASTIDLQSVGADNFDVKKRLVTSIKRDEVDGGTCIACGLEEAVRVLKSNGKERNKYIILFTDGYNNDRSGVSDKTPIEVAQDARDAGIKVMSLGMIGKKGSAEELLLSRLASNPGFFWLLTSEKSSSFNAIAIVDQMAGDSCLVE
jgi:hypothetical protein